MGTGVYRWLGARYKGHMPYDFTVADMLRKARKVRRINQETLGQRAARFPLGGR